MSTRHHYLAGIIQQLSKDEGTRQPSPDQWLLEQDEKAKRRHIEGSSTDVHYQSSEFQGSEVDPAQPPDDSPSY